MKNQKGQTLIEFTLILPIALILFFGCLELGWYVFSKIILTNATITGAEYAVGETIVDPDEVEGRVREVAHSVKLGAGDVEVIIAFNQETVDFHPKYVTVAIEHEYKPLIGSLFFNKPPTIRSEAVRYYLIHSSIAVAPAM